MMKRIVASAALTLLVPAIASAQVAGKLGGVTFAPDARTTKNSNIRIDGQAAPNQEGPIMVAGFIGATMDTPEDWFHLGGDVRLPISNRYFEINPRLSFQPFEGGHTFQIDVNVIWELQLANPGRFRPFAGVGGAFINDSFGDESDNNVGLNLVAGVRLAMDQSRIQPFAHIQYTLVRDRMNPFAIAVGAAFPLR